MATASTTPSSGIVLARKRASIKGQITRLSNILSGESPNQKSIEVKLNSLRGLKSKIDDLRNECFSILSDIELVEFENSLTEMEDNVEAIEVSFLDLIMPQTSNMNSNTVISESNANTNIKLPSIALPQFSGKYTDWLTFKAQFTTLIDENNQLTDSQKLYYLQSSLTGTAKQLQNVDDSYSSLFEALKNRYENKRLIVNSHITELLNLSKIKFESCKDLRNLIDNLLNQLRALKQLGLDQNKLSETLIMNIVLQRLDDESRKAFEMSLNCNELPSWDFFIEFISKRIQALENVQKYVPVSKPKQEVTPKHKSFVLQNDKRFNCSMCHQDHFIHKCKQFSELSAQERLKCVKKLHLCFNCLGKHMISQCKKLGNKCKHCSKNHHSILHGANFIKPEVENKNNLVLESNGSNFMEINSNQTNIETSRRGEGEKKNLTSAFSLSHSCEEAPPKSCNVCDSYSNVLLSTALIYVRGIDDCFYPFLCILDSGSEISAITADAAKLLGLKEKTLNSLITGINGATLKVNKSISAIVSNKNGDFKREIKMLIVPKITELTPAKPLDISNVNFPQNLNFANPSFFKPQRAQILLGGDIFYELLQTERIKLENSSIILQNSVLGWIVTGRLESKDSRREYNCNFAQDHTLIDLQKFWDLESLGIRDESKCQEGDEALSIFQETVKFENQRYEIALPWKRDFRELNNNLSVATKRLKGLVNRMNQNEGLYSQYTEILHDYLEQGIVEKVPATQEAADKPLFYLPHHPVFRKDSVYTKCRIVFDASSCDVGELSLNDCLWTGTNLNPNVFHLLTFFRLNKIAILSDIERAFLQIALNENDKDALRFLFTVDDPTKSKNTELQVFRFNRLPFGVNASPFLLSTTIKHHNNKFKEIYPTTANILDTCFYVDDLVAGADTLSDAIKISTEADLIMKDASMHLRKWVSNDESLMKMWEEQGFSTLPSISSEGTNELHKVLGMSWNTKLDTLTMEVEGLLEFLDLGKNTKRFVLQAAGRIFDPVGLVTPYTIRLKILLQELWLRKISWDDELPSDIKETWRQWCSETPELAKLQISRNVFQASDCVDLELELHAFADASPKAYGAAIYLRVKSSNQVAVNLVASKSRVAPLKRISLPRLELLAALLASRLAREVQKILDRKGMSSTYFWTDSQITLCWIQGTVFKWKPFVANRVKEIQSLTDKESWKHCAGSDNPADLLTRGISSKCLVESAKWWTGPDFLKEFVILKCDETLNISEADLPCEELRKCSLSDPNDIQSVSLITTNDKSFFEQILNLSNSYVKLIRILSFVLRFVHNCRNPSSKIKGFLTTEENRCSENWLLSSLQSSKFQEEFTRLKQGEPIPSKSKLNCLNVFLDENLLIRVGGRLRHSDLSNDSKFPIILPGKHKLTDLILNHYHLKYFHLGAQALLYQVRQKFWPLNGRNNCRRIVHSCVICFKNKPVSVQQIMADLPRERVTPNFVFNVIGIDFCGPFLVKFKNQRKGLLNKIYVAVFICLCTKAIHLDFVSDLTSQAFIACLKRFFGRRGKCSKIMSDNGKTFIGANVEIKKLFKLVTFQEEILSSFLSNENIVWEFIPPKSPNFGGLWEAGVKAFKFHFKRVIGSQKLTLEEFVTILAEIEGVLNSRPLVPLSADFDDFRTLSPGHFLIGRPITSLSEPLLTDINESHLSKWQRITKFSQQIWRLWKRDYLNNLQGRTKWKFTKDDVKLGTLVLIKDEHLPATQWSVGRIMELFPSKDAKIRVVNVRMPNGNIYKRNVRDICILPVE